MYQKNCTVGKSSLNLNLCMVSLILISSQMFSLGMLASTETKIMNTSASSSPVLRGKWAILEFDLSAYREQVFHVIGKLLKFDIHNF